MRLAQSSAQHPQHLVGYAGFSMEQIIEIRTRHFQGAGVRIAARTSGAQTIAIE